MMSAATSSVDAPLPALSVSTMTLTGRLSAPAVDIHAFFAACDLSKRLRRVEYIDAENVCRSRGDERRKKRKLPRQRFENQITVLVRPYEELQDYLLNLKLFRNGMVQMTGARHAKDARICVDALLAELNRQRAPDAAEVECGADLVVQLINSDFREPFSINNYKLQAWILKETELVCIYEPCIYPGVKMLFFWNTGHGDARMDGVCRCRRPCTGKGSGREEGACKKITVSVFQSGSVIVTGAVSMEQLEFVHRFVHGMLVAARSDVEYTRAPGGTSPALAALLRTACTAKADAKAPTEPRERDIRAFFRAAPC